MCGTPDWEVRGSNPTGTGFCPSARHIIFLLYTQEVVVPDMTVKLLAVMLNNQRKEKNWENRMILSSRLINSPGRLVF